MTPSSHPSGAEPGAAEKAMRVELGVFSGRPDPSWLLGPAQRAELVQRLADLPAAQARRPPPGGLGYRGLTVTAGPGSGLSEVRVYRGQVSLRAGNRRRGLGDPGRRLERWLLHTGQPHLEDALYQELLAELGG